MGSTRSSALRSARPVHVDVGAGVLAGDLAVPDHAGGLVVFAHGSGSSRFSPRNRHVADTLHQHGLATLLIDLLTEREEEADEQTGHLRFDVRLLAERLVAMCGWAHREAALRDLQIGFFGASTGGGAALVAAAEDPHCVRAVVSRGGRPDLADAALTRVLAPTLLIVGERDETVLKLNERAMAQMHCDVRLEIVPRATHLFEEPGALDRVARLAADWFVANLASRRARVRRGDRTPRKEEE
jgi:putative phosphoribosyl transferase